MNARTQRPGRVAPLHRGPQALPVPTSSTVLSTHAPNAALLIDFDNVTMGIRSDLQTELRNMLSSDIVKGKVAVQRAYADWRRYPQYIVPLSESSIDLIFAPAYGSSKKNATDIRLAIDALELVFTRPEIGTFILLSGDSDFSSLVIKLKEYGKYVIGVGIRESSSDLLVQNCDEYYSYNALAGLVKLGDEELVKWDPWELVVEAVGRMKRNGDVMRSDRLKQVMQEIDSNFDEKDLGFSKFSRFCLEAANKGLLVVNKLDNGQFEVAPSGTKLTAASAKAATSAPPVEEGEGTAPAARADEPRAEREERGRRGRRGGRGRGGSARDREERAPAAKTEAAAAPSTPSTSAAKSAPPRRETAAKPAAASADTIGISGERLTRDEAFDLVRRATGAITSGNKSVAASAVRKKAFDELGRDSESLAERNFTRILKDAHDANVIDLRRRGDDFEVALAVEAAPVADQLNRAAAATQPAGAASASASAPPAPRGMAPRGGGMRGRSRSGGDLPPELLAIGVVDDTPPAAAAAEVKDAAEEAPAAKTAAKRPRKRAATKKSATAKKTPAVKTAAAAESDSDAAPAAAAAKKSPAKKKRARAKKTAASGS